MLYYEKAETSQKSIYYPIWTIKDYFYIFLKFKHANTPISHIGGMLAPLSTQIAIV